MDSGLPASRRDPCTAMSVAAKIRFSTAHRPRGVCRDGHYNSKRRLRQWFADHESSHAIPFDKDATVVHEVENETCRSTPHQVNEHVDQVILPSRFTELLQRSRVPHSSLMQQTEARISRSFHAFSANSRCTKGPLRKLHQDDESRAS